MQQVISDSSTLIHLSAIHRFELIREYFPSIIIPRAVYQEVVISGNRRPGSDEIIRDINKGTVKMCEIQNTRLFSNLCHEIHPGEAEVIVLAMELDDPFLLIDDHDARRIADRFCLRYTGIIGILIRARNDGKISSLREEIEHLRTVGRFWISDQVMCTALRAVGEE